MNMRTPRSTRTDTLVPYTKLCLSRLLSLSVEYRGQRSTGGAGGFPGFTLAVEAAFPDRFVRDASGRLVRVDARPIRIVHDITARLNNGLTLMFAPGRKGEGASAARATNPWRDRQSTRLNSSH